MKIIDPLNITDALIESSNLPDDGFQNWVAAGPINLLTSYTYAAPFGASKLLLYGNGPRPAILDTSDFSVIYAPDGFDDFRAGTGGSQPPISPDGTQVAFVTHNRTKLSVFSTSDFSLVRSQDLLLSGNNISIPRGVAFNTDGSRIGVLYMLLGPDSGAPFPVMTTYNLPSFSPANNDRLHVLGFLPDGSHPDFNDIFSSNFEGFAGVSFSWVSANEIVYGLMSLDGNAGGRGIYTYNTSTKAAPTQQISDEGNLWEHTHVVRNPGSGDIALVRYDSFSNQTNQGRTSELTILDSSYSVKASPVAFSDGVRIFRTTYTGDLLVTRGNLSPFCRIYDGGSGYALIESYTKQFIALSNDEAYLYRSGTDDYLAEYPSSDVVSGEGEPYAEGDTIIFEDGIYESLKDGNIDVPEEGAALDPPSWLFLGTRNERRLFNGLVNSQSVSDESGVIDIAIRPGKITSGLALLNLQTEFVRVTVNDPDEGLVYDSGDVSGLDNEGVTNWYTYFFEPYRQLSEIVFTDLPAYTDAVVNIKLSRVGDTAAVGEVVLGMVQVFGDTVYGTSVGILDFSTKTQDRFGNFSVVERAFSKRAEYDVYVRAGFTSSFQNSLARFRAKPVVWVGAESQPETIVYGYYRDFDIVLSSPAYSECTITVEGL